MVPMEVVDVELERDFFGFGSWGSLGCFRGGGLARAVVIALQKCPISIRGVVRFSFWSDCGNGFRPALLLRFQTNTDDRLCGAEGCSFGSEHNMKSTNFTRGGSRILY